MRLWYFLIFHARIQEISSGGGGSRPILHKFFSPQLNLQKSNGFFSKKIIIFQDSRGAPTFSGGGGGGGNFSRRGGGPIAYSLELVIFQGVGSDPLSPSGSSHETHSSDVLFMV